MAAPAVVRNLDSQFLDGLLPTAVTTILSAGRRRRYLANSVMVNQGHPAEYFFLLESGRARYFYLTPGGRNVILRWITPGDIFAPAALLARPVEYLVSVEAVKTSWVLAWDRATIRELTARYPQLIDNAMLIMFDYFRLYRDTHTSMTCDAAPQRLAHVLGNLARSIGHRVPGGIEVEVRNEELANEANITTFTASRLLSEWQRKRLLTKGRGKVIVRSPERLFLVKD